MSVRHASTVETVGTAVPDLPFPRGSALTLSGRAPVPKETDMQPSMRSLAAAIFCGSCLLVPPMASAQTQSPSPGVSEPSTSIPDEKLDKTAAAVVRVATLKQEYEHRIAAAPAADQEGIAKEAVTAMAQAVTEQGLSLEEYTAILQVAQNEPDIRDKIRQRIATIAK